MKKTILFLISLLLLVACTNKLENNEATKIAYNIEEFLNNDEQLLSHPVKVEPLEYNSMTEFYIQAYVTVNAVDLDDEKLSIDQLRYLPAFEKYFYEVLNKLNQEKESVNLAQVGYKSDQKGYVALYIFEFEKEFDLDDSVKEDINQGYNNGLEYIALHKNVLVVIEDGFVEKPQVLTEEIQKIIESN